MTSGERGRQGIGLFLPIHRFRTVSLSNPLTCSPNVAVHYILLKYNGWFRVVQLLCYNLQAKVKANIYRNWRLVEEKRTNLSIYEAMLQQTWQKIKYRDVLHAVNGTHLKVY